MTAPTRPKVAMLLYPGRTPLDLIAPHAAFAGTMETHLVWKSTDPVQSDSGVVLQPTTTFADCPADLDASCSYPAALDRHPSPRTRTYWSSSPTVARGHGMSPPSAEVR